MVVFQKLHIKIVIINAIFVVILWL